MTGEDFRQSGSAGSRGDLARALHASSARLVIAVTGGGSLAISDLLTTPGASRTLLEAVVPYSAAALADWLGAAPEQCASEATARAMAAAGMRRARQLDPAAAQPVGIGCTASLASDRPKRGAHRAFVAFQTVDRTVAASLELVKDRRSRAEEERLVANLILCATADAARIAQRVPLELRDDERVTERRINAPLAWQDLMLGRKRRMPAEEGSAPQEPRVIFPGAFNPLHDGHRRMAETAESFYGEPVAFELSIENVDKPPLDYLEIEQRAAQFRGAAEGNELWMTAAPTFVEKVELFPKANFLVGIDTIRRIADERYYGSAAAAEAAFDRLAAAGCQFLVFGRAAAGGFETLSDVVLPPKLAKLCKGLPANFFREDISSTELRRANQPPDE